MRIHASFVLSLLLFCFSSAACDDGSLVPEREGRGGYPEDSVDPTSPAEESEPLPDGGAAVDVSDAAYEGGKSDAGVAPLSPRTDPASRGVFQLPYAPSTTPRVGLPPRYKGYHDTATRVPGWDFMTPRGTPLVSPLAGKVITKAVDGLGNTYVELEQKLPSGRTLSVVLMHANYTVQVGQTLRRGDPIGTEASNGNSSEPHSHVSVHLNHVGFDFMNDARLVYDPATRTYLVSGDAACATPCTP